MKMVCKIGRDGLETNFKTILTNFKVFNFAPQCQGGGGTGHKLSENNRKPFLSSKQLLLTDKNMDHIGIFF